MANPTSRHCNSRTNKRRANWKATAPSMVACPSCDEPRLPHRVCPSCGTYNNRKVLNIVEKEA